MTKYRVTYVTEAPDLSLAMSRFGWPDGEEREDINTISEVWIEEVKE